MDELPSPTIRDSDSVPTESGASKGQQSPSPTPVLPKLQTAPVKATLGTGWEGELGDVAAPSSPGLEFPTGNDWTPTPKFSLSSKADEKSIWVYPSYANEPYVHISLTENTDLDDIRKTLKKEMGVVEEGVAKITFLVFMEDKQYVVPLNSIKIFAFDTFKGESEFCFRLQDKPQQQGGYVASPTDPWHDDVYFDSYAWMQIHWEMLSDYKRCQAYYNALQQFSEDVKGKVILDVGCGTGILSIYAARCGAKKVYAIDASSIVIQAEQILNKNGMHDVVELIHGKCEEIILPVKEVDLIVSEWMGYFLLCESMLESVIYARDKWLAPGGKMFPCEAKLYLAPVYYNQYYTNKVKFFESPVDGVDVSPLLPYAAEEFTTRTLRCFDLPVNEILCEPETIKNIDIYTITKTECRRTEKKFKFAIGQNQNIMLSWPHSPKGHAKTVSVACSHDNWVEHPMSFQDNLWRVSLCFSPGKYEYKFIVDGVWIHDKFANTIDHDGNINNILIVNEIDRSQFNGFGSWFDVTFKGSNPMKPPVVLSTDPRQGYQTCWKQDVCLYGQVITLGKDQGMQGSVEVKPMKEYARHLQVSISCGAGGSYHYRDWSV